MPLTTCSMEFRVRLSLALTSARLQEPQFSMFRVMCKYHYAISIDDGKQKMGRTKTPPLLPADESPRQCATRAIELWDA